MKPTSRRAPGARLRTRMLRAAVAVHLCATAAAAQAQGDTTASRAGGQKTGSAGAGEAQIRPPLDRLSLLFDRGTSLVVVTGAKPATNLRVVHSTLHEPTTGAHLPQASLELCGPAGCGKPVTLRAGTATPVRLAVKRSFGHKGTFGGSVFLASDENPAGFAPFELKVLSTTHWARGGGAALILAGIVISLIVTVFLRHRALRLQALFPARRLVDEARRLRSEVEAAETKGEVELPQTHARLKRLQDELADSNLEARGYVGGRFAPAIPAADASGYGEFLKRIADEVATVQLVAARGFTPMAARWLQNEDPRIQTALEKLDPIAADTATPVLAEPLVTGVWTWLNPEPGRQQLESLGASAADPALREVQMAFQRTNASLWGIWALVTWVTGIAALIATNYAFGAGLDYYTCFLWGIGVQVAGNQLQQLAPSSVATAFSISMPKA